MQHQTPGLRFKFAPSDGSTVEGYLARFGERDLAGDIIDPGAFAKTLAEIAASGHRVPMLLGHRGDQPIGSWRSLEEDGDGLYAVGELDDEVEKAREALSLVAKGHLSGLSIGYIPVDGVRRDDGFHLTEIKLLEGSLVAIPAAPRARVVLRDFSDLSDFAGFLREGGMARRDAELIARKSWPAITAGDQPQLDLAKVLARLHAHAAERKSWRR